MRRTAGFGGWHGWLPALWLGLFAPALGPIPARAGLEPGPAGVEFFERKIRPVLVKECYSCHSSGAKKVRGGLRLDSRAGMRAGGETGPAVVPGQPEESVLLDALRYDGIEMPPKGRLPAEVVADFERWVKMGAPDPRDDQPPLALPGKGLDIEAGRRYWAYRAPRPCPPPEVADPSWPGNEIDRFVLAGLEAKALRPVADADRATLARRVAYDLVGLPPTPEEIDAFVNDASPTAFANLVDRLLASPRFGERWGRHWLDVVRFGESLTLRGFVFKHAWRYRDYVIDAFNDDRPFDRFLQEQIAGDLLPAGSLDDRRRQSVATTFLTLGNTNLEDQDKQQLRMDVVDEQLDTIGKAFLAQTIGCARCHDHKFDPIPAADYYALAGILRNVKTLEHANVSKWLELPLPAPPEQEEAARSHERAVAALEARLKALGGPGKAGPVAAGELPGIVVDDTRAKRVGAWQESTFANRHVGAGFLHDRNEGKGEKSLTFQPDLPEAGKYEVRLAYTPAPNRAGAVPVTVFSADGEKTVTVDMRAEPPIDGRFVSLGTHSFEKNGQGYVLISNEGTDGYVVGDAVLFLLPGQADKPTRNSGAAIRALEADLKRLRAEAPPREMVMTVVEEAKIEDARVHVRGSVHTLGELVPRGFLRVATDGSTPAMPGTESGRRELAAWLASPRNPLTARVLVNRAWHWLFGAGLARTPDNFGTTGEAPSHPELLDVLALRFVEDGWSVKSLVRRIVLSRTYRLSAGDDPKARAIDPENRLLWRANRRRLDAECLRDTILFVSGRLDPAMGGPSFPTDLAADYGFEQTGRRRSVYVPVFRNALPELFEVFDFADPSLVVGRRDASTVAPQALFLLNHPFAIEQARQAARRLLAEAANADDAGRLERAYRLVLGRPPAAAERRVGLRFVAERSGVAPEESWAMLFQALFASMDFRYVD